MPVRFIYYLFIQRVINSEGGIKMGDDDFDYDEPDNDFGDDD